MFKKILHLFIIAFSLVVLASCGEDPTTTTESYVLPDLAGYTKSEIITELDSLGVSYVIEYETNLEITEDEFVSYDGYVSGDTVTVSDTVIVKIATQKLILPDLTGLSQLEILTLLSNEGINFNFEAVTDNNVEDGTFSSYEEPFESGDLISSNYTVTINIGYNQTQLPDLTGMIVEEIKETLDALNISYSFEYVLNDDYEEDLFAGYKDMTTGDYYDEGNVVINLYENTFTDNSTSLIISKYVDGGDDTSNQAIELFNATSSNIDLSDYHLAIYTNGSLDINYSIDLEAVTLAPGDTYVIANSGADAEILIKTDLSTADLVFDGNDVVQLCYSNGTYIDTIYNIGDTGFIMDNEVFVRDSEVLTGTREYAFNEWDGYIPTYVSILGSHPVTLPESFTIELTSRNFDDPLGGMDLVTLVTINDGDTAGFTPGFLDDERVRFIGVDTPETYTYPVEDWGLEAKEYTTLLLNNAEKIYIQSDPDIGYTGGYDRHLGLVWVDLGDEGLTIDILASDGVTVNRTEYLSGWVLINYQLVLNGYSYNYYSSDSTLAFENRYLFRWFQDAEKFAEENGLGIHE